MQTLNEHKPAAATTRLSPVEVPQEVALNLNPSFELRPYQKEAFARFVQYTEQHAPEDAPSQLLFHMATGSGKTLIMAGCMLQLYQLGYRHFIFFVNSTQIIEKTRDNFLNALSSKYLFAPTISIKGQRVVLKEVENFEAANNKDIHIVFTTIQGLHSRLNNPRENSLTYEDFEDKRTVLLSDEAHHINAETKKGKLSKDESEAVMSWEGTVTKVFNASLGNYLLEFTATADFSHPEIKAKYENKLLFDYPLRQFRQDGYSKEVKVLQTASSPLERALQAVILSQYRRKVFEKNGRPIKPVLLFKSKTIAESQAFFQEFAGAIRSLSAEAVSMVQASSPGTVLSQAFDYFSRQGLTHDNLVSELQEDFSEDKCIAVDSKNDSEEKQLIINSLEDENNAFRAVFAVDKLNEGWDVLNLFDIVRLYDTRDADAKAGKAGKTTVSEAQLIGRGARYCPFRVRDGQPRYQRKYDEDPGNELRIGEELYFHASYNPRYISELNRALEGIGLKPTDAEKKKPAVKDGSAETGRYAERVGSVEERLLDGDPVAFDQAFSGRPFRFRLATGAADEAALFSYTLPRQAQRERRVYSIRSFGQPIIRKALNRLPFYRFCNLKKHFPHLTSTTEFIESDSFLSSVNVTVEGAPDQVENLRPVDKLDAAIFVLSEIERAITSGSIAASRSPKELSGEHRQLCLRM